MWTIREGETPRTKVERMAEAKIRIMKMKDDISEISCLDVYFNSPMAHAENYDIVLVSEFRSWSDLEIYQKHPSHMEVVDYLKNVRQNRAAIDYEF
jgi:hypothetical protein